jgi:hypothetical protein
LPGKIIKEKFCRGGGKRTKGVEVWGKACYNVKRVQREGDIAPFLAV